MRNSFCQSSVFVLWATDWVGKSDYRECTGTISLGKVSSFNYFLHLKKIPPKNDCIYTTIWIQVIPILSFIYGKLSFQKFRDAKTNRQRIEMEITWIGINPIKIKCASTLNIKCIKTEGNKSKKTVRRTLIAKGINKLCSLLSHGKLEIENIYS